MDKDFSKILESYLIPTEESLIISHKDEVNINSLGEKKTLVIFSKNINIPYGGISISEYTRKCKANKATILNFDQYISYRLNKSSIHGSDQNLIDYLQSVPCNASESINILLKNILTAISNYAKERNILIAVLTERSQLYACTTLREYPIIINDLSMLRNVTYEVINTVKDVIKHTKAKEIEFKRFDKYIPSELYVKDLKFDLYHVSPVKGITQLTPRVSSNPLFDENIRIPRVSAASTVDACFRAVGMGVKDKPINFYVYKLKLDSNLRIVKPNTKLVPDVEYTNEYWILDPVDVDCLGYIKVIPDKKNKCLKFDDSNMVEKVNVVSTFRIE